MPVYVDDMRAPFGRMKLSHMISTTSLDELHEMADRIGVRRKWFQDAGSCPHYDVCEAKRLLAISLGAVPVKYMSREMADLVREARKLHPRYAEKKAFLLAVSLGAD